MPDIDLYNMQGDKKGTITLSDEVFSVKYNASVVHQALVRQMANARRGTASTKTRGEVSGGGRKPWRQKGTGRARHGSIRSPLWKGGGVTFGPKPRDYSKKMPRKMRRMAIKCVLSDKVENQKMIAMDGITFSEPKTKKFVEMMGNLKLDNTVLFVISERDRAVEKSASNLKGIKVITLDSINIKDILHFDRLVMTSDAINRVEEVLS